MGIFYGTKQGTIFLGPELEEARTCRYALHQALSWGIHNVIIEGDSQVLIAKLQKRASLDADVGLIIHDTLVLSSEFSFVLFNLLEWKGIGWPMLLLIFNLIILVFKFG